MAAELAEVLRSLGPVAIAVSGGVDSVTMAAFAHRTLGPARVTMLHAVSPAVPAEVTARLVERAARDGWQLQHINAGELDDPRYVANPVNRCFFCKSNLYGTMRAFTDRQLLSGTNVDDLGEYRPGLRAAEAHGVRHPFVEVAMRKNDVRTLARALGLDDVAELPASPCLSSRIETGIPIAAPTLAFVHAVETMVRRVLMARIVRCRVRSGGVVVVELDDVALEKATVLDLVGQVREAAQLHGVETGSVHVAPYVNGSAFLRS